MPSSEKLLHQYSVNDLHGFFKDALAFTLEHHSQFVQTLSALSPGMHTSEAFLGEYTWVIFASGFNAGVVYKHFPAITKTLSGFKAEKIQRGVIKKGCRIINNPPKWTAIVDCARLITRLGWQGFQRTYLQSVDTMEKLPRIGPVTRYHLARNLGHDVVKPDLHLIRAAERFGGTPLSICQWVQVQYPDLRLGQIDFAIWCFLGHGGSRQDCCGTPGLSIR